MIPLSGLRLIVVALGVAGVAAHRRFDGLLWIPLTLIYLALLWPHRRRPGAFQVRQGRFVVPPSPLLGLATLLTAFYVARMVWHEIPEHGPMPLIVVLIAAHGIGIAWLPQITLTQAGIEVRRVLTRRIPWGTIAPDGPVLPGTGARSIEMLVQRPNGSWRSEIMLRGVRHIDEAFFVRTVQFYLGAPERRTEIGTAQGHERLLESLAVSSLPRPSSS